mmetsp:Transcript_32850/g.94366  ORF Transcript_32850/g.94366 Transcript_32850/m.94366 type:complete len:388 (-) Transcript_32850:898-2061(-)
MAQSSNSKSLNSGTPAPMFRTSTTEKASSVSQSTAGPRSSLSSSLASSFSDSDSALASSSWVLGSSSAAAPSFALFSSVFQPTASAASFLAALKFFCFSLHCLMNLSQRDHFDLNQSDGLRSSTRVLSRASSIHAFKCSCACSALLHSNLSSSKPSAFSGRLKSPRELLRDCAVMSGACVLRKTTFFSSSVSSTFGGSSLAPSSSSSSSSSSFLPPMTCIFFGVSSSSPASDSFLLFSLSARLLSSSRWRLSEALLLFSSACFALNSTSAFSCFSFSMSSHALFLKSAVGSPTMTRATLVNRWDGNSAISSVRFSATKLLLSSMTTMLLGSIRAAIFSIERRLPSSSSERPKPISGLSLEDLSAYGRFRGTPLRSAQSRIARSLSSA